MAADVKKVLDGMVAAGGPVFSRRGYLLFTDAPANRILKWEDGKLTAYRTNSNNASALTFDHEGRLLACESNRLTRTEKDGMITVLMDGVQPRDVVYSIEGSIYFTAGKAVYQIPHGGQGRVVAQAAEQPGGIALSPNQQRLYVSDTGARKIWVYEFGDGGALANGRVFANLTSGSVGGLKTSEDGAVWVATQDGIVSLDASGTRTSVIPVPEVPTNCNWGEGFHGLYVTAGKSVYRVGTKVAGTRTY